LLRQVTHLRDMEAARDRMKAHRIDRALLVDEVVAAVGAQRTSMYSDGLSWSPYCSNSA
jgi:hypothetical protein